MEMKDDSGVMDMIVAHLERIENKVDRITDRLSGVESIQVKQEQNLAEHMRRSDLLEQNHQFLRDSVNPVLTVYSVAWGVCRIILGISILFGVWQFTIELLKR